MSDKSDIGNHLSSSPLKVKQATKPRCSGRLCATATFAIVAVLAILVLTAVVGVMFASAQSSEVKNKHSDELEKLKKEMEILKKLVDQQANKSITQQIEIQTTNKNLHKLNNSVEQMQQQLDTSNYALMQNLQKKLNESTKDLNDTIRDLNDTIQEVQLQLYSSSNALKLEIENATDRHKQTYTELFTSQIEQIQNNVSEVSEQIQLQRNKFSQDILNILRVTNDSRSECKLQIEILRNFTQSTIDKLQQQILEVQAVFNTSTMSK